MLKVLLTNNMKISLTIDDDSLKFNSNIIQTLIFTKKSTFCTKLGFVEWFSGVLGDIVGFVQFIPGSYKTAKPVNFTGIGKNDLKCDCIPGSIVLENREPIL